MHEDIRHNNTLAPFLLKDIQLQAMLPRLILMVYKTTFKKN
jgi:hypothetical protein